MATKTGAFGYGGPGYGTSHQTSHGFVITAEMAAEAAAGPSVEEIVAESEAEEKAAIAEEKAEKKAAWAAYHAEKAAEAAKE